MKYFLIMTMVLMSLTVLSQTQLSLKDVKPDSSYENIYVKKISDDAEQTTFIIWVKKNVRAHYHAYHSENIIVVEGKARMIVDGQTIYIKAGDYLNIPKGKIHAVLEVTSSKPLKVVSVQSPKFDGKDRVFVDEN